MGGNALVRLNAERCESELSRVKAAVSRLLRRPAKVDFYSVAAESGVSRSTLYRNPKLRSVVEAGRASQPDPWGLIGRLTAENDRLRAALFVAEARIASGRLVRCDIKEIPLVA